LNYLHLHYYHFGDAVLPCGDNTAEGGERVMARGQGSTETSKSSKHTD
jgi:hypothetical protein